MINIELKAEKRMYTCPEIVSIELDNEISLALESSPPNGPGEGIGQLQLYENDPFKNSGNLV